MPVKNNDGLTAVIVVVPLQDPTGEPFFDKLAVIVIIPGGIVLVCVPVSVNVTGKLEGCEGTDIPGTTKEIVSGLKYGVTVIVAGLPCEMDCGIEIAHASAA